MLENRNVVERLFILSDNDQISEIEVNKFSGKINMKNTNFFLSLNVKLSTWCYY